MDDLSDDDYAAIGLSPERGRELQTWVLERVGYVFDKHACGGSGIFVKTRDGDLALLTASHVVIHAVVSGELSIGAYDAGKSRLKSATCIICSSTSDAALVMADGLDVPPHLTAEDWHPERAPDTDLGTKMVAGGLPGKWKGRRDVERRVVEGARVMLLLTEAIDVRKDEIETVARWGLPPTLGGMSGGPLFSVDRQLLGIHKAERRHEVTNELRSLISTRRQAWSDLYDPRDEAEWPKDLEGPPFRWEHRAKYGRSRIPVVVGFEGWFGTSPSQPSHSRGAFGLIEKMRILNSEETRMFPINIWSRFIIDHDDDQQTRTEALRRHARELLNEMDFALEE